MHCGADLFLRTAYQPDSWPHRVSAWTEQGAFLKLQAGCQSAADGQATGETSMEGQPDGCLWDVVGPLCFRGDIVAQGVWLPSRLRSGMAICVHDAGAYTLGMFSRYNSRQAPPVYGFRDGGHTLSRISEGETIEEALRMWQVG